jgi:hypothetical protein
LASHARVGRAAGCKGTSISDRIDTTWATRAFQVLVQEKGCHDDDDSQYHTRNSRTQLLLHLFTSPLAQLSLFLMPLSHKIRI